MPSTAMNRRTDEAMRERIPEKESVRVKRSASRQHGKAFRSARKAIAFCQERNNGQAMKMFGGIFA